MKKDQILSETEKRKRDLKDEIAAPNGKKIKLDRDWNLQKDLKTK